MNFKFFLIIYLQLIYTSLADFKLTTEDVILPTKMKTKYVDMMKFDKLVVNDSAKLALKFRFQARNNFQEETKVFYFNNKTIDATTRPDIDFNETIAEGSKIFTLTFSKLSEKLIGQYTLVITAKQGMSQVNATANLFSPPFLQEFLESKRATEGGRMEVICKYTAFPAEIDNLEWKAVNHQPSQTFRMTSQNASLFKDTIVWDILIKRDAGYYRCDARNKFGNDSVIMQLRVKDRLAPLWPFIGIVIEVIILLAVIIFYERQKSIKKNAERESNPMRESLLADKKASDSNEDVRHRSREN